MPILRSRDRPGIIAKDSTSYTAIPYGGSETAMKADPTGSTLVRATVVFLPTNTSDIGPIPMKPTAGVRVFDG